MPHDNSIHSSGSAPGANGGPERGSSRRRTGAPVVLLATVVGVVLAVVVVLLVRGDRSRGSNATNEFTYDLEPYLDVDPSLVLYSEVLSFDVALEMARGIDAREDDSLCVVGDRVLRTYAPDGQLAGELELAAPPYCVDASVQGRYYVGFQGHVEVYDSGRGERIAAWPSPSEDQHWFTSIEVVRGGAFVADARQRVVWRFDDSGNVVGTIGRKDPERRVDGLVIRTPYLDVAMSSDGLLRVSNPGRFRVEAYTSDGDLELHWGKPAMDLEGFSGCCNPCNFALLSDGRVITCEKGIPRVKEYDANGVFVGVVAGPRTFAEGHRALKEDWRQGSRGGLDVAVDSKGRVAVLDPLAAKVRIFVRRGEDSERSG